MGWDERFFLKFWLGVVLLYFIAGVGFANFVFAGFENFAGFCFTIFVFGFFCESLGFVGLGLLISHVVVCPVY